MRTTPLLILSFWLITALRSGAWEPVYPQNYPHLPEMPLLSICVSPEGDTVFGSRDGYMLASIGEHQLGSDFDPLTLKAVKLPFAFDISAASGIYAPIVGGSNGQIAYNIPAGSPDSLEYLSDPYASLAGAWELRQLETDAPVRDIMVLDDIVLVLAGRELFRSTDGANSWNKIEPGGRNLNGISWQRGYAALMNMGPGFQPFVP